MATTALPERNKEILEKILDGGTFADVSREYGISGPRVRQIVLKLCNTAKHELKFHFRGSEWEQSLIFFRKNKLFIYAALEK